MMKTIVLIISLALFFAGISSCSDKNFMQKENLCTAGVNGDTVVLGYNQPATLFEACDDKVGASITQINDSRCPEDVTCVWAGKLSVLLQFNSSFSLNLEKDKLTDTAYLGHHYSFTLLDVRPHPNSQKQIDPKDKKVMMAVVRR